MNKEDINIDETVTLSIKEIAFLYSCVVNAMEHPCNTDDAVNIAIDGDWKRYIHVAYDTTIEHSEMLEDFVEQLK